MATLGEYLGAGSATTKLLLHLNGNSTDSSGNGNNGTDTNITYSQANGKFGQGAGFNGSSSQIQIANSASLNLGTSDVTLILWIKTTTTTGLWLFDKSNPSSPYQGLYFGINNGTANKASFAITDDAGAGDWGVGKGRSLVISSTSVNDGVWHNIIAVRISTGYLIYVDGKLDGTRTETARNSNNTSVLKIGNDSNNVFYNGSLDEPIIENRAWSAEEVKKYYTMAKGRYGII